MDFDTEKFISEVESRPAIWNTKSADYSNKNVRSKAWEDLVNIYGGHLPQDKKRKLGVDLEKKWRNIRDAFVKSHKAKEDNSSSAEKKRVPYAYYNRLLFMKDYVGRSRKKSRKTVKRDLKTTTESEDDVFPNISEKSMEYTNNSPVEVPVVNAQGSGELSRNLELNSIEDDGDRLFFLSLVKEFKKVPEQMQMQAKLDILKVIKDAQQIYCVNEDVKMEPRFFMHS